MVSGNHKSSGCKKKKQGSLYTAGKHSPRLEFKAMVKTFGKQVYEKSNLAESSRTIITTSGKKINKWLALPVKQANTRQLK